MAVTIYNIIPRKYAENSQTAQYTATNCKTVIDKFTATNISSSNVTFSVNLIAAGDVAASSNLVLDSRAIAPGECYTCPELIGQTLESGGFISTLAGAANSITISASGREVT